MNILRMISTLRNLTERIELTDQYGNFKNNNRMSKALQNTEE